MHADQPVAPDQEEAEDPIGSAARDEQEASLATAAPIPDEEMTVNCRALQDAEDVDNIIAIASPENVEGQELHKPVPLQSTSDLRLKS